MMDEAPRSGMKPMAGHYRVDFNGTTLCYFDVDDKGAYTLHAVDQKLLDVFPKSRFSALPSTVHNMHPDHGMFGALLKIQTKSQLIGTGLKGLSGIRIFPVDDDGKVPERGHRLDFLETGLHGHTDENGVFTGTYLGPVGLAGTPEYNDVLSKQWVGRFNHRFSGKQTKMPCCLKGNILMPAIDSLSFSHFFKSPTVGGREADGLLEWAGLRMARAAGLPVNEFALINQGDNLPPAIAVERFDIAKSPEDLKKEWVLMQDFYSIIGEDPKNDSRDRYPLLFRYDELVEGLIKFCEKHDPESTERNVKALLTRIFMSWAGNDADLHAKNLSVLMRIDPETRKVKGVEFAPVYDACLSTMCGADGEPMFYNLTKVGKGMEAQPPRKLNMNDFMAFLKSKRMSVNGKPFCIFDTEGEAKEFIRDIASKVAHSAVESFLSVPQFVRDLPQAGMLMMEMQHMAKISVERAKSIGADVPKIDFDPDLPKLIQKCGSKVRKAELDKKDGRISDIYHEMASRANVAGAALKVAFSGGTPIPASQAVFAPPTR